MYREYSVAGSQAPTYLPVCLPSVRTVHSTGQGRADRQGQQSNNKSESDNNLFSHLYITYIRPGVLIE